MTSAAAAEASRYAVWVSRVTALALIGFSLSWVLVVVLAEARFYVVPGFAALGVDLYHDYARDVLAGLLPYRDIPIEYPPLALVPIVVPALIGGLDDEAYREAFQLFHGGVGMVTMILVMRTVAVLGLPRRDVIAAALTVTASPLLLGPLMLARYDLWPALFVALAVYWLVVGHHRLTGLALGLAILAKVYPVVLGPFILWFLWQARGRRAAVDFAIATAVTIVVLLAPLAILAPEGVFEAFVRNFQRPLQVESSAASVLYVWNEIAPFGLRTVHSFDSHNITMAPAPLAATLQAGLLVVALFAYLVAFMRGRMTIDRLLVALAGALCAWVALGKVLSPQYLMWVIAPLAVVAGRGWSPHLVVLGAAVLLTGVYYPGHYAPFYVGREAPWIAVVAGRNVLLLALTAYFLVRLGGRGDDEGQTDDVPAPDPAPATGPAPAARPTGRASPV